MLNIDLNAPDLAEEFAANKSLVIDNYLDPEYIEVLSNWFNNSMPEHWWFASYRATASGEGYENTKYINHSPQNKENMLANVKPGEIKSGIHGKSFYPVVFFNCRFNSKPASNGPHFQNWGGNRF